MCVYHLGTTMSIIHRCAQTFDLVGHGNPIISKNHRFDGRILRHLRSFDMFKARHSHFTRDIDHINWCISWILDKISTSTVFSFLIPKIYSKKQNYKSNPLQSRDLSIGRREFRKENPAKLANLSSKGLAARHVWPLGMGVFRWKPSRQIWFGPTKSNMKRGQNTPRKTGMTQCHQSDVGVMPFLIKSHTSVAKNGPLWGLCSSAASVPSHTSYEVKINEG